MSRRGRVGGLALCVTVLIGSLWISSPVVAAGRGAAACTGSVGPGISPPASVQVGFDGFHAAWYGQSGYQTLCPGTQATATVAFINTGSAGWVAGRAGQTAFLGTSGPEPGQDLPSVLGGNGTLGTANTGWPSYNRVAVQPANYVGPGQVAWFQFTVQAPMMPGTYRLAIRPLVEGATWMEDYGVFWYVTVAGAVGVAPTPTPLPTLTTPPTLPPTPPPLRTAPPVVAPTAIAAPFVPVGATVRTCIEGDFSGFASDMVFELCNGQVWVQTSFLYRYHYAYRPAVVIVVSSPGLGTMAVDGMSDVVRVQQVAYLRTCINGTYEGFTGETIFALCNGQVWQQTSYAYHYHYAYRPPVLLYESPAGGVLAVIDGEYDYPIKVWRIR